MKVNKLSAWFRRSGFRVIPRHSFTEPYFEPYVKAIGSLLLAWNDLHERLSTVFVMAMGVNQFARSFAIWHDTRNDLGKRKLLRAAIANLPASEIGDRTKLVSEITWILDTVDKLEGFRDDSAHTPLDFTFASNLTLAQILSEPPDFLDFGFPTVVPQTGFANPRAMRIEKKAQNMLVEYRYARSRALVLRDYAIAIDTHGQTLVSHGPKDPICPNGNPAVPRKVDG